MLSSLVVLELIILLLHCAQELIQVHQVPRHYHEDQSTLLLSPPISIHPDLCYDAMSLRLSVFL